MNECTPNRVRIQSMTDHQQSRGHCESDHVSLFHAGTSLTDLNYMSMTVYSGRSAFSQGTRQEINFKLSI